MSPRPILKRSPSPQCYEQNSELPFYGIQAVHFPPSPSMTHYFDAHPSSSYDRSPIVVSPNTCALPERGCPGRTYTLDEQGSPSSFASFRPSTTAHGGHLHPRALAQRQSQSHSLQNNPSQQRCPPLVPDLSSESDESDGFISPPPESSSFYPHPPSYIPRNDRYPSQLSLDNAVYFSTRLDNIQPPSPTEPRRKSRRERERIRTPTVHVEFVADDPGYDDDRDVPASHVQATSPKKSRCRKGSPRLKSGFNDGDDGSCLGGF